MQIVALGASNEVNKFGYVAKLALLGEGVRNLSIGACGSSAGVFNLLKSDFPPADFALLSYEANENFICSFGLRSDSEVEANWRWMISQLRRRSITPVLIILPTCNKREPLETACRQLQRQIATDNGCHFVDLTELFIAARKRGMEYHQLMLDDMHISEASSIVVAEIIQYTLNFLYYCKSEIVDETVHRYQARLVKAEELAPEHLVERHTSLTGGVHAVFTADRPVTVEIGQDEAILAVALNRHTPGGYLEVSSDCFEMTKQLTFSKNDDFFGRFLGIITDFGKMPVSRSGTVTFRVSPVPAIASEATAHAYAPMDGVQPELEIEALLVRSIKETAEQQRALRRTGAPLDLLELFDQNDLLDRLQASVGAALAA